MNENQESVERYAKQLERAFEAMGAKKQVKANRKPVEAQKRSFQEEVAPQIPKRVRPYLKKSPEYVNQVINRIRENQGVYVVSGINGTGKTALGASVAYNWNGKVKFTDAWEMLNEIKSTFESKAEWKIPKHSLLIIDEFEKFSSSEWASTTLDRTICKRYDNCLPTLIITNATKEELNNICTGSLIRRIKESNGFIEMNKPYWN